MLIDSLKYCIYDYGMTFFDNRWFLLGGNIGQVRFLNFNTSWKNFPAVLTSSVYLKEKFIFTDSSLSWFKGRLSATDLIASFDNQKRVWSKVGKLNRARSLHSVAHERSFLWIVGGASPVKKTSDVPELCRLEGDTFECKGNFVVII